jgi:polar amino acid transport system substrate-binding protein
MKQWIVAGIGAVSLLALGALANSFEDIKTLGEIRLANSVDYEPFYYKSNGKLTGFEVELGNAIAAQFGVEASWRTVAFDSLFVALQEDRVDVAIASHTITPARARVADFANPHYCTGSVILSKKGGPLTKEALRGKVVGVTQSSTFAELARTIPGIKNVVSLQKENDVLESLRKGQVDAVITDRLYALNAARKFPNPALESSALLTTERIGMAVRKGNSSLVKGLNDALTTLQTNGTYAKLSEKWFGADIRCQAGQ